jgi:hypothetical protein
VETSVSPRRHFPLQSVIVYFWAPASPSFDNGDRPGPMGFDREQAAAMGAALSGAVIVA